METEVVQIRTPDIALDALLKFSSVVGTGGEAKHLIQAGLVQVNGNIEQRRGHRVGPGDRVDILDEDGCVQIVIEIQAAPA